jgi:probable rRNA maturation factor
MTTLEIDDSLLAQSDTGLNLEAMRPKLLHAAMLTLHHQQVSTESSLTILLSGDEQLQQLNRQFLGIDAPTDVLSFPAGETDPESGETYLGDVIISGDRAQAQATAGGHTLADELQLLIIHGVLHLLGHDHAAAEGKASMWAAQSAILAQLGVQVNAL